jgi:hypothetical protein
MRHQSEAVQYALTLPVNGSTVPVMYPEHTAAARNTYAEEVSSGWI